MLKFTHIYSWWSLSSWFPVHSITTINARSSLQKDCYYSRMYTTTHNIITSEQWHLSIASWLCTFLRQLLIVYLSNGLIAKIILPVVKHIDIYMTTSYLHYDVYGLGMH